jgi:hypothetical protein
MPRQTLHNSQLQLFPFASIKLKMYALLIFSVSGETASSGC